MPKISVIIPVYGVEKYIERCAISLFEQTINDVEYIFIDDCTTDLSIVIWQSVIDEYGIRLAAEKEVVRIEKMPSKSGLAAVRRHGVQLSTGDYVIHCDSDDWVDITLYEKMYNSAIENNSDVVITDFIHTDNVHYNIISGGKSNNPEECILDMMYRKMWWTVWNKLFRRNLISDTFIYPCYAMGEDMVITLQLMSKCRRISYVKKVYYYYFINSTSISLSMSEKKCMEKFNQLTANYSIVKDYFLSLSNASHYTKGLHYLDFYVAEPLEPLLFLDKYFRIWKQKISGTEIKVMLNSSVHIKYRIKALLIYLGVYRFVKRITL